MTGAVLTLGESMGSIIGDTVGGFDRLATARVDTGGAEGNVAIGLARLGVPVTWLGRIGDDSLGRRVAGDLRSEGVDVVAITDPDAPTGLMLKSTPRAGATAVDYYRRCSAGSRLSPADLDAVDFAAFALLHVTGITPALSATAADTVRTAIDRARAAGCLVSFDVNHRSRLWGADTARSAYREIAARADLVIAGDDEARLLLGGFDSPDASDRHGTSDQHGASDQPEASDPLDASDPLALARALTALGPAEAIVKLGPAGAVAVIDGVAVAQAGVTVPVVDTVGAGDAFTAAYLAERLAGAAPAARMRTAVIAGALACTHPSDWQGLPRRAELDGFAAGDPVRR